MILAGLLFYKDHNPASNPKTQVIIYPIRKYVPDCKILQLILRRLRIFRMEHTVQLYQILLIPKERRKHTVFRRVFCK